MLGLRQVQKKTATSTKTLNMVLDVVRPHLKLPTAKSAASLKRFANEVVQLCYVYTVALDAMDTYSCQKSPQHRVQFVIILVIK